MFTLTLTENWNGKLFCHQFSELVLFSAEYKQEAIGDVFLNNTHMGMVKIVGCRSLPFCRISNQVSLLNIGLTAQAQAEYLNRLYNGGKMLPADTMLSHIVLAYLKRNMDNQTPLIKQYWDKETLKATA